MTERTVFLNVLDLADPTERAAYLERACAGDEALRRQVDSLLAAHEREGEFLNAPAVQVAADALEHDLTEGAATSTPQPVFNQLGETQAESPQAEGEKDVLALLAPSHEPGSLGRLDHYEVLAVVGSGGMGVVLKARDTSLQRVVAIKVLAPQLAVSGTARKRFVREARAAAAVRDEHVVSIHAVQEAGPVPYLVMEYIDGATLEERIKQRGPVELKEVLRIGMQMAEGLAAAHKQGLIHRDIKPANILLENGVERVKITDFGLARAADDASLTQSGVIAGTPLFMSPEQAEGQPIDQRSDLFSLGSVLYAMCTGRAPFRANTTAAVLRRVCEDAPRPIREINPEIPEWLAAVVARLHAKRPEERFKSAAEVAELFSGHLAQLQHPSAAAPPTVEKPAARPPARLRRWAVAAAVLACLFGGLGLTEATGVTKVAATVIRILTPDGTLVVQVDDPDVSVAIDGQDMVITGAGIKEIRLKPGQYKVLASKDGKVVRQELVTVVKNGREVVRVDREAPQVGNSTQVDKDERDRRVAAWVLSRGGTVMIDDQPVWRDVKQAKDLPEGPWTVRAINLCDDKGMDDSGLKELAGLQNLGDLHLGSTNVTDAGLKELAGLKNLSGVCLDGTGVTDAGLKELAGFPNLRRIYAGGTAITDAGLKELAHKENLQELELFQTAITDAGLKELAGLKAIRLLLLMRTPVTDAGLVHLRGLTALRRLDLTGTKATAEGIAALQTALPRCKINWDGGVIEPSGLDIDRRAAEYVLSIGGTVSVNDGENRLKAAADLPREPFELTGVELRADTPVSDAGLAAISGCKDLKRLSLEHTQLTDAGLTPFKGCTDLTGLFLGGTQVGDAGLANFKDCKELEWLDLNWTQVSDAGLAQFKDCNGLKHLCLDRTQVSDVGLAQFKDCKELELLTLEGTQVSDVGLAYFKDCKSLCALNVSGTRVSDAGLVCFKDCKKLAALWLGRTQVSDVGLAYFKDCKNLTGLGLENTRVSDVGLAYFKDCKNLTTLRLIGTRVSDAGLAYFKDCNSLQNLGLGGTRVSDVGLAYFKSCKNLTTLRLNGTRVSDAGLAYFKGCKDLTLLFLDQTQISDAGLIPFKDCKKLTYLKLQKTKVTAAEIDELKKALPGCRIEWDSGVIEPAVVLDPDRLAAEYVLSIGGTVQVNDGESDLKAAADLPRKPIRLTSIHLRDNKQVSDAGLARFKDCKNLKWLDLEGTQASDAGPVYFQDRKNLMGIWLSRSQVTDAGLATFKNCKNLVYISLAETQVDDAGLADFKDCKSLCTLDVSGTQVSDAGLVYFKDCKNLTYLGLGHTQVSDVGMAYFKDRTNLTFLSLYGTRISDAGLSNFKDCKNLTVLALSRISDAGLSNFKDCKNLRRLFLNSGRVSDAGLVTFKDCKELTNLDLSETRVSDAGLAYFKDCKNLLTLHLAHTPMGDAGLAPFKDCKKLAALLLDDTQVGDAGLAPFKDCKNLKDLGLHKTKVTAPMIDELKKALPQCRIEWDGGKTEVDN